MFFLTKVKKILPLNFFYPPLCSLPVFWKTVRGNLSPAGVPPDGRKKAGALADPGGKKTDRAGGMTF